MKRLYCRTDGAREDLEAFRLFKSFAGEFLSLVATKHDTFTQTFLDFEKFSLVLRQLNFASDAGPGCLEQVLVELGADRESVAQAIQNSPDYLHVRRGGPGWLQPDNAVIENRLGGDLVTVTHPIKD